MLTIPSEIKTLLNTDSVRKNFRVCFPNGEHSDLTASNINGESVSFTESICSQNSLKFGLCESPYIEFECVNVGDISGATIECYCEIFCPSTVSGAVYREDLDAYVYPIPFGRFIVDEAEKQADKGHRKVVAYTSDSVGEYSMCEAWIQNQNSDYSSSYTHDLIKRVQTFYPDVILDTTKTDVATDTLYGTLKPMDNPCKYDLLNREDGQIFVNIGMYVDGLTVNQNVDTLYTLNTPTFTKTLAEFEGEISEQPLPAEAKEFVLSLYGQLALCDSQSTAIGDYAEAYTSKYRTPIYAKTMYKIGSSTYGKANFGNIIGVNLQVKKWVNEGIWREVALSDATDYFFAETGNGAKSHTCDEFGLITHNIARKKTKIRFGASLATTVYKVNDKLDTDTVRDIGESCLALSAKFGRFNRNGGIDIITISDTTATELSQYVTLWYDDTLSKPFGVVSATYKDSNNVDNEVKIYINDFNIESDETKFLTYDLSDDYLFKNAKFTEARVGSILETVASNIEDIRYTPMELTIQGRPDIQAGDLIEVEADAETLRTIVMQRTLTGIQSLFDDIESN